MWPEGRVDVTREDAYASFVHWALAEDDLLATGGSGRVPETQPHLKFCLSVFLKTELAKSQGQTLQWVRCSSRDMLWLLGRDQQGAGMSYCVWRPKEVLGCVTGCCVGLLCPSVPKDDRPQV